MLIKIPVFLDGNSLVHYNQSIGRLIVGNSDGLIKIFDPEQPDLEPTSIDIPENLTAISSHGTKLLIANTEGQLALLNVDAASSGDETYDIIYRSELPLRDAVFINDGKRIVCGGDDDKLIVIDVENGNKTIILPVADQIVNISHNSTGEITTVGLANGDVHVYSVINESPELIEKIANVLPTKVNTSIDAIDFKDEHSQELICTASVWSQDGELVFVPTSTGTIKAFDRSGWNLEKEYKPSAEHLIAFALHHKHLALLHKNGAIHIFNIDSAKVVKSYKLGAMEDNNLPINVAWNSSTLFVGSTNGELHTVSVSIEEAEEPAPAKKITSEVEKLFMDEASESETEEQDDDSGEPNAEVRANGLDDSMIIDEEEDDGYYNRGVDHYLSSRIKRQKVLSKASSPAPTPVQEDIVPYSPGSTPWVKSVNSSTSATQRRYLFMNSIGYAWSVKNASVNSTDDQKSISISFFDRTVNKDYHFIDYYDYDLCSVNERGVLLGCSGYKNGSHSGRIFYRHHNGMSDSWDRQIPLLKNEYITSLCLTSSTAANSGDSIIVVGSNLGYLRFFNLYGLCINLMKVSPVVTLISSEMSTVFIVHQVAHNNYSYSLVKVNEDYKFFQQDCSLPLKMGTVPLIKGIFFNEYSDPCLVAGSDDSLTVLSHWRETGNARWIPILSCGDVITDYGLSDSKKNWKSWPLGLTEDKLVCLILKNSDSYPGFPLPLPVELDVKLPVTCFKHLKKKKTDDEETPGIEKLSEENPEEVFLRASTLGKLVNSSLADIDDDDEPMERLSNYSVIFDKSLLRLFANACQDSRLNRALSVVKLIKNDKALLAASKIAERFEFINLANKISKLREDLLDMDEEE